MVSLKILEKDMEISDPVKVKEYLGKFGIKYEKWSSDKLESEDASPDKILQAYSDEINRLKREGGYATADVIDINRNTPGLEEMLNKFDKVGRCYGSFYVEQNSPGFTHFRQQSYHSGGFMKEGPKHSGINFPSFPLPV